MKQIIGMIASLILFLGGAIAQDTTRQQAQPPMHKHERMHQEEHLLFLGGKLYRVQQGVHTPVKDQVRLQNGGVAKPDGSYQLKGQKKQQLRDGECLDMSGNRYQSQHMYNKGQMMTPQQMHHRHGQGMHANPLGPGTDTVKKSKSGN